MRVRRGEAQGRGLEPSASPWRSRSRTQFSVRPSAKTRRPGPGLSRLRALRRYLGFRWAAAGGVSPSTAGGRRAPPSPQPAGCKPRPLRRAPAPRAAARVDGRGPRVPFFPGTGPLGPQQGGGAFLSVPGAPLARKRRPRAPGLRSGLRGAPALGAAGCGGSAGRCRLPASSSALPLSGRRDGASRRARAAPALGPLGAGGGAEGGGAGPTRRTGPRPRRWGAGPAGRGASRRGAFWPPRPCRSRRPKFPRRCSERSSTTRWATSTRRYRAAPVRRSPRPRPVPAPAAGARPGAKRRGTSGRAPLGPPPWLRGRWATWRRAGLGPEGTGGGGCGSRGTRGRGPRGGDLEWGPGGWSAGSSGGEAGDLGVGVLRDLRPAGSRGEGGHVGVVGETRGRAAGAGESSGPTIRGSVNLGRALLGPSAGTAPGG